MPGKWKLIYVLATQSISSCALLRKVLARFTGLTNACNVPTMTHIMTHSSYILICKDKFLKHLTSKSKDNKRKITLCNCSDTCDPQIIEFILLYKKDCKQDERMSGYLKCIPSHRHCRIKIKSTTATTVPLMLLLPILQLFFTTVDSISTATIVTNCGYYSLYWY